MKALFVIDIQDIYLKRYKDTRFIKNINRKIDEAHKENVNVVYIKNVGLIKSHGPEYQFCESLSIVSENVFIKKRPDAFSNADLLTFLQEQGIKELELVGIDGAICVYHTAKGAINNGFAVSIDLAAIAAVNEKKFQHKLEELRELGVNIN